MGTAERPRLIYIGDPLCSWCYGFAPQLLAVASHYRQSVDVEVMVGGLRTGTTEPMDDAMSASLRHHWQQVEARSGQAFNYALLARRDFVYDTEPPCRAVVAARTLQGDGTLEYFYAVQRAFYADNRDTNDPETYRQLAAAAGMDDEAFMKHFDSAAARAATLADFEQCQRMGVRGFPTLLFEDQEKLALLCTGFAQSSRIIPAIAELLGGGEGRGA